MPTQRPEPRGGKANTEVLDEIAQRQEKLRRVGRSLLGVEGTDEQAPPLRQGARASGVGWYPLIALGILVVVDEFQGYGFAVLGPEISRALGISKATLGALLALKLLAITLATLPIAAYVQRRPRRALVAITMGFGWALATLFTGFVVSLWGLLVVMVADGLASGSVRAVHQPLLVDSYPPSFRVRALSFHRGANRTAQLIAPLLVGLVTAVLGFTWRGVFLAMGVFCLAAALFSVRLRDPGFGSWDVARVRQVVRRDVGAADAGIVQEEVLLGFFENMRRLLIIPTVRRVLTAYAVLGMWFVPLETFMFFFLNDRWNMGPGARALFFAGMSPAALGALWWYGRRGERLFRTNPRLLVELSSRGAIVMVVSLLVAVASPVFVGMLLFFAVSFASASVLFPSLSMLLLSVVPPTVRVHASALSGIALAAVGGMGGLLLLGGIDRRFGVAIAVASLSIPGAAAALILRGARETVNEDLDRLIDHVVEEEEIRTMKERGISLPMLACRHLDFSYGRLQVLFDVDFTVEEGQMVALLGTNGAGKSTLLRAISGLGLPSRGSVHFHGADITYLDAERRVGLGITQIPGGRAVFGSLSVVENLRVFGFGLGKDSQAIEHGIEATFEAFPGLAARRNQASSTLSGGEQQMLGLGKALILHPRLLLIDELSLGLAPKIVGQLLEVLRRINATGTAIVLVEQSVNIALAIAQHAYFMEKGEIRFQGAAAELIERRDLLRSVFLEGATKGLG
ncbi:MAG: ATP-binding protein [Actinomycetota bacterium]